MESRRFDETLLQTICTEHKTTVELPAGKLNKDTKLTGKCATCTDEFTKTFESLVRRGPYCTSCIRRNQRTNKEQESEESTKLQYDEALLNHVRQKYGATITLPQEKLTKGTRLTGQCITCRKEYTKTFQNIVRYGGPYCTSCTKQNSKTKREETNMNKYGKPNPRQVKEFNDKAEETLLATTGYRFPMQNPATKEKAIETCKANWDVDWSVQSSTVREKGVETNLKIRGVRHPMQDPTVKQKVQDTTQERYGVANVFSHPEFKEKIKQVHMEKYGFPHAAMHPDVKAKARTTCMERYGCAYPSQVEEFKQKAIETNMQRRDVAYAPQSQDVKDKIVESNRKTTGCPYPLQSEECRKKFQETCMATYGHPHPTKSDEVKEKTKATIRETYGQEHFLHDPVVAERHAKSMFCSKEYIFPSGRTISVQGYEPLALDILLRGGTCEDNIKTGALSVPTVYYMDTSGNQHRYYTDIFIPTENLCIEVKSEYTFSLNRDVTFRKQQATKEQGYRCEVWIFNNKKELIDVIE